MKAWVSGKDKRQGKRAAVGIHTSASSPAVSGLIRIRKQHARSASKVGAPSSKSSKYTAATASSSSAASDAMLRRRMRGRTVAVCDPSLKSIDRLKWREGISPLESSHNGHSPAGVREPARGKIFICHVFYRLCHLTASARLTVHESDRWRSTTIFLSSFLLSSKTWISRSCKSHLFSKAWLAQCHGPFSGVDSAQAHDDHC